MRVKIFFPVFLLAITLAAGSACNKFIVEDVNYSQQVESVLEPDENGMVEDVRHGITFNIKPFEQQESSENDSIRVEEVRMIRNSEGYYFITADQFKNVYVMEPGNGNLKLKKKIQVSDERLMAPAFNLRDSYVQLVRMDTNEVYSLNENGIQKKENMEEESWNASIN